MKNVCASTALSFDVYRNALDAAELNGLTLSSFISLAIGCLLEMEPEELAALCSDAGRKPKRVSREQRDE